MSEREPASPELTLAEAWLQQLHEWYWQTQELLARANMVGAALWAREVHPLATHVVFETSDQGPYQYVAGVAMSADGDLVLDDEDYGAWEFRDEQAEHWAEFITPEFEARFGGTYYLDIDKVLAEVPVPWHPVAPPPCRHEGGEADCHPTCSLLYGDMFWTERS